MVAFAEIHETGVYRNDATQCYEAWFVDARSGDRRLVSTCSVCVDENSVRWWERLVWDDWLPKAGYRRP